MKKLLLIVVFCSLFYNDGFTQNLLPNEGFEYISNGKLNGWEHPGGRFFHYYTTIEKTEDKTVANSFLALHFCNDYYGTEYIRAKLKTQLIKGKTYCFTIRVWIPSHFMNDIAPLHSVDVLFSKEPYGKLDSRILLYHNPQIKATISDENILRGFVTLKMSYVASGGENYLTLGKFQTTTENHINDSLYQLHKRITAEQQARLKQIDDSLLRFYPPLPDVNNKKYSAKKSEKTFAQLADSVNKIEALKITLKKEVQYTYKETLSLLEKSRIRKYNLLVYLDDLTLQEATSDTLCSIPQQKHQNEVKMNKVYTMGNIRFGENSAKLENEAEKDLDIIAQILLSDTSLALTVNGHTDSTSSEEHNNKLSVQRSNACKIFLMGKGISDKRIQAVGYGSSQPLSDNQSEEGRQLNRRVEFIFHRKMD